MLYFVSQYRESKINAHERENNNDSMNLKGSEIDTERYKIKEA